MNDTDLIMVCTSDLAGQLRGKAIPKKALERRREIGVGWTPTNIFITSFGPIAPSPWGALGDLYIQPDFSTQVALNLPDFGVCESFVLGDIKKLNGERWECCLRSQLASAIALLQKQHGLTLQASFEHEFYYYGCEPQPGLGYTLRAFRRLGEFPNRLMKILDLAGFSIDTFMPEYGPSQYEVTVCHKPALRAADEAVILRELVRATARGLDTRVSFAPTLDPNSVGNGVHVHFSLFDSEGEEICYSVREAHGVSRIAGAFVAGILRHMPEFLAMTAPTVCSYMRLIPKRWSAAYNNLGDQDREAAVRICPVFNPHNEEKLAQDFHFEFRAADAAASPYLVLAALINAGISGINDNLSTPIVTSEDLTKLDAAELAKLNCERLPQSLSEALSRLSHSKWGKSFFGDKLIQAVNIHKRAEIEFMSGLSDKEICELYSQAF